MRGLIILGLLFLIGSSFALSDNNSSRFLDYFARPVALNDTVTINQGESVIIAVLANDSDPDGDPITLDGNLSDPFNGTAVQTGDNFEYTPDPSFVGRDSFQYVVCEDILGSPQCKSAWVIVIIQDVNEPPDATDDAVSTDEEVEVDISVLTNDPDPENDALTFTILDDVQNGTTVIVGDVITYTPTENFTGTDSLRYEVCDPEPLCDTTWVRITVNEINDPPDPMPESITIEEDAMDEVILPLDNDYDVDGDDITIGTVVSTTTIGATVTVVDDTTLVYTPPADFSGVDTLIYESCDPFDCVLDTIIITITPINDAPVAVDDAFTTEEDTNVDIIVNNNDSDVDDQTLITMVITDPVNGSIILRNDTMVYVPDANYFGMDSLQYTICDPEPLCDTAWVRITVNEINDPPDPMPESITIEEDAMDEVILPLDNDIDADGDDITIGTVVSTTTIGATVTVVHDTTLVYTPPADFSGVDTLIYESCDPFDCVLDTIIITITPINDAPVAVDDAFTTEEDTNVDIIVNNNDSDVDDQTLITMVITDPVNGSIILRNDTMVYVPDANYFGMDSLQYTICDPEPLCDTAWVRITVNEINDPPEPMPESITIDEDTMDEVILPLDNDIDADGDDITIGTVVSTTTIGATITVVDDTTIVYTPPADFSGVDTLIYESCDPFDCVLDTIIITIIPINDAPVAVDDAFTTEEDTNVDIIVNNNDSDVDDQTLITMVITDPVNGSIILRNDTMVYVPDANYFGMDSLQYTICDPEPLCDTAWVRITVNEINDPPEPMPESITIDEDTMDEVILPLDNDIDADGDDITIGTVVSTTTIGATITVVDDTTIVYTPPADFSGVDTLIYESCDPFDCVLDTIIITIIPINDAPVAVDDAFTTEEDTNVDIIVNNNDSDVDDQTLTSMVITDPVNGSIILRNDTIVYVPDADYFGMDSLQYTICDTEPLCDTAWVRITVTPVNDPPGGFGPPSNGTDPITGEPIICVIEDTINVEILPFGAGADVDGDELTIDAVFAPTSGGTVVIQGDTMFFYTPPAEWSGQDTIAINVCDPSGLCTADTIYITVKPVMDPIEAIDDEVALMENDSTDIEIVINDSNPDGGMITITIIDIPVNGTATLNGSIISYNPDPGYFGLDSFTYEICNPVLSCDRATVLINVAFVNEKPVAVNDALAIVDTTCVILNIQANDSDPNGDTLVIQILNNRTDDVTINTNGTITYCPPADFNLIDTIYYSICDTHALQQLCDTAMIVFNMTCPVYNHALVHDANCPDVDFSITGTEILDLTTYTWSFDDQLGVITNDPEIIDYKLNSSKTFVLNSQRYGCAPQNDSITVDIRADVPPASLDDNIEECENSAIELAVNNPDNLLTYQWYDNDNDNVLGSGVSLTINDLNNTTVGGYYVIANDGICNSVRSNTLDIQILADLTPPTIEAGEEVLICGSDIQLNAVSTNNGTWTTNGNAFIADINDPQTKIFDPAIGENKFYWNKINQSCVENSIDSISVFYYPEPDLGSDSFFVELNQAYTFDVKINDFYYNLQTTIRIVNTPEEVTDHGDGTFTVTIDGSKDSPLDFEYEVCFDECPDNCQTTVVNVHFEQPFICVIPDVITPNGDAINDFLVIDCINQYPQSSIIIFNRWGDEVYNNKNYDNSWNGTKDGEPLAIGTYFYIFKINDVDESVEKGFIHIDR